MNTDYTYFKIVHLFVRYSLLFMM